MMKVRNAVCLAFALLEVSLNARIMEAREPRVVFNDDAQMLMETPQDGATAFVKAWLDREIQAVPFTTYVFLAATPDICTYDSKQGETYGDRFDDNFSQSWAPGIRALRAEGTDVLKVVTSHMPSYGHAKPGEEPKLSPEEIDELATYVSTVTGDDSAQMPGRQTVL
ncbi:MAG: hypothetical protein ABGZ17_28105, partial [Planctomycetaceae bacterium]